MKSLPKISIVIPSYNKAKYIGETLKSIVSQNYLNLEVIIQDGGSNDGTVEIIKQFAKKYSTIIKWTSEKDNGQAEAINKGLKKATGEILTYINADDIYEKGALKMVGKYFTEGPSTLWLAGKGSVINAEGKEILRPVTFYKNLLLTINHYLLLKVVNYLIQPSVFLSRHAYQKYGPFSGISAFVTEYDLWLKLAKLQKPVVINRNLSKFRIEKDTKTKNMFQKLLKEDERILKKHTGNLVVLFLHKIHNIGRSLLVRLI
jgi:hypothetical protein